MKKLLAIVLVLAMLLGAGAHAETAESAYMGIWYAVAVEAEGQTFPLEAYGVEMAIELREDGTGLADAAHGMERIMDDVTWQIEGDHLKLMLDGDPAEAVIEDGKLRLSSEGFTIVMTREKAPAGTGAPAAPVTDAAAEGYTGAWYMAEYEMDTMAWTPADLQMTVLLELRGDGSAVYTTNAGEWTQVEEGRWTWEDGCFAVSIDEQEMKLIPDGEQLISDEGEARTRFVREKPEATTLAQPKKDAALSDYSGTWVAFKVDTEDMLFVVPIMGMSLTIVIDGTEFTMEMTPLAGIGGPLNARFVDGALRYEQSVSGIDWGITLQLMEDDTLTAEITILQKSIWFLKRAE